MASSEKKRRLLKFVSNNNLVGVIIIGLISVFAPEYTGIGKVAADQAEAAVDQRVQEHCDKHGGC
jgi:hypothetical protein